MVTIGVRITLALIFYIRMLELVDRVFLNNTDNSFMNVQVVFRIN